MSSQNVPLGGILAAAHSKKVELDWQGLHAHFLIANLAFVSDSAVVTSGGAEFHICIVGKAKLFSLILDLKPILSLFRPALLVLDLKLLYQK